jgi:RNA polymerase sigma-70 factor (ECF subfamily)
VVREETSAERRATDADAIGRSLTDPAAFVEVVERHLSVVHRFLRLRLGEQIATDMTSETFAVAFKRRADYDPARPDAHPWLLGIAVNLVRQQ